MKNYYPYEKFSGAIHSMLVNPASIQKRIADAYLFHLIHLKPDEIPQNIRDEFKKLHERISMVEPKGDEGSVAATVKQMTDAEAIEIAESIYNMAYEVEKDYFES
jgi:uncharacterized protein YktB (UPF0637 family)